jgi:Tol biopolymer transport system component
MFSGVVWLKENNSFIINIKIKNKTTYELWGINLDGSGLKQLTDHPKRGSVHPAISPDGKWIAFETGRDGDDGEIYIMKPDGSEQTRLTFDKAYDGRPAWIEVY